jgi:hypothetical protein
LKASVRKLERAKITPQLGRQRADGSGAGEEMNADDDGNARISAATPSRRSPT